MLTSECECNEIFVYIPTAIRSPLYCFIYMQTYTCILRAVHSPLYTISIIQMVYAYKCMYWISQFKSEKKNLTEILWSRSFSQTRTKKNTRCINTSFYLKRNSQSCAFQYFFLLNIEATLLIQYIRTSSFLWRKKFFFFFNRTIDSNELSKVWNILNYSSKNLFGIFFLQVNSVFYI